ncbi:winged helix-turn-helix domain-containing protein [Erythrobacter sp.]|uniref:winged helix-turn-helix domain-containing protein n=1 Tax=Erythrobacter sp. TaxID=1042 RepID=UPI001425FA14|nr:winged helix-turn-helix domain-containing protein [Erythrobacter sp.]QIQ86035.1 MAG: hypothetical protein G9473_04545 [Erythrobacter sp.]
MNEQPGRSEEALAQRARRIDLAHHSDFALGPVRVRPSLRRIVGPDGEAMLEPKVMQVLIALSDPIGALLSRDDLIDRCWDGRVIGDTSINRVISLLRGALRDVAGEAVVVENVPKVGYRLVVRESEAEGEADIAEGDDADAPGSPAAAKSRRGPFFAGIAVLVAVALAAVFALLRPTGDEPLPDISVAMLPLGVAEGVDPLYAAGLESELRAQFAQVGAMEVTASESARMLLEEGLSPTEIGKRLGAHYVWAGDFAVEAERAALDLRLIDVDTGEEVLVDRLSSAPDAAQHLPFRTARSVSLALGRPVRESTLPEAVSASDFKLYLVANGLMRTRGMDQRRAALEILGEVTARNPRFAAGWGALAKAHFLYPAQGVEETARYRGMARAFAERALEMRADTVEALKVIGIASEEPEVALANLERAVELDPGDSEAWFWLSIQQQRFLLEGGDPMASALRMVAIDPLWPAVWNVSTLAAEFGRGDLARKMERDIAAASATPAQEMFAEARLARLEGDLSRFVELTTRASRTATDGERLYSIYIPDRMIRLLLDLPLADGQRVRRGSAPGMLERLDRGDLPARAELERAGLAGKRAWDDPRFMEVAAPLFLETGREREMLEDYDARFASPAAFAAHAEQTGQPYAVITGVSPYLVLALRRAGRDNEAAAHLAAMKKALSEARATGLEWLDPLLLELDIAALEGDAGRAAEVVARLPDFGWPFAPARVDPSVHNLLRSDPLYGEIRQLPEVDAVLDPIRRRLSRERAEVLSLGL